MTALSVGGLRRRIETALMPDSVNVVLQLDRAARRERDQRRQAQAQPARLTPTAGRDERRRR